METYLIVLLLLGILSVTYVGSYTVTGQKASISLMAVILIFISGFRYYVGTDYYSHVKNFSSMLEQEIDWNSQPALTIIARISTKLGFGYYGWFFTMAAITIGLVMIAIWKYSDYKCYSVFLYIFLGCWVGSFNTIKQAAAAAILFFGYDALEDRKFLKWVIICCIAAMFHVSAFAMIPVYFLVDNKMFAKKIIMICIVGVALLFSYDRLYEMFSLLRYETVRTATERLTTSVNIFRILVAWAPVIFVAALHSIYDFEDKKFCTLYNLAIFNAVLSFSVMNSVYLSRATQYTRIFNILLIPYLAEPFVNENTRRIINIGIVILFFAYWWIEVDKSSTLRVYQWIFGQGLF